MPDFVPGLQLSESFYLEAVKPILDTHFPTLTYGAALIGSGSEVLGYDTPMSSDHHWGPRVMLFLPEGTDPAPLDRAFSYNLPFTFRGYSTNFGAPNPADSNTRLLETADAYPIAHRVEMFTVRDYVLDYLGLNPRSEWSVLDWLTLPSQRLLTLTSGKVFHDGLGDLTALRERLAFYPDEVWRYLMAAQWDRIGEEEHLMGRAGSVGDEIGSALIAARLVRDLMRLCFLMERHYAPYPKWFGTAFARLTCGPKLMPILQSVLTAETWRERQLGLVESYRTVATMHNALDITPPIEAEPSPFHGRPFMVIQGSDIAATLLQTITDPTLRAIQRHIGSIDQLSDCTAVVEEPSIYRQSVHLYQREN